LVDKGIAGVVDAAAGTPNFVALNGGAQPIGPAIWRSASPRGWVWGFRREQFVHDDRSVRAIGHPGYTRSWFGWLPEFVVVTNRLHVTRQPTPHAPMWQHAAPRLRPSLIG
jgi:hypothetical protein